ncbi:hypothetical protein L3X38_010919 [Prunus dulcis]|uniref:Ubiquitin-like protease family profile domain-containing protein n=1 Tax=Prunus dulcis TaxID=3755 RepID=A0AAD4ZF74_PRUDU|nr:hypothetical protein L3X38_010919 [Prunus dulcis]
MKHLTPKKSKSDAFKVVNKEDDRHSNEDCSDEELTILTRRFINFLKNQDPRSRDSKGINSKNKFVDYTDSYGHISSKYANTLKKQNDGKNKALHTTWSGNDFDSENNEKVIALITTVSLDEPTKKDDDCEDINIDFIMNKYDDLLAASQKLSKQNSDLVKALKFDFSEQWFLFFPYLIKYKEKETRVVLSVKMVSQQQTKDSGSKKLGIVAPQDKSSKEMKSSKKMKFASSSAETESQTTISDDSKTGRGMSTMPRVVKRKLQKVRPIVEYNKMGKGIGQAHIEMQSYIGVLARSRVPLVDKKWSQIPKDVKEQIWEAVDMAFVVGQGGKKSVLASAAKKWKDFKSTLTRHYILPYTNDKEKLSHPPETYKFIEKAQWDAFVASRLSQDFESVHSQHAQIREKLEYNHRLSRKGYAGLEDELEETMPGIEIDRSTLWKRARQDKHGNIPDPKVAENAKLIDDLQKQVSEGKVRVDGSKDVLTMALGPEHPGRLRGVGAGISPRQYFNLPKPQRVSFDDRLKESLRVLLQEETKKMEAKAREEALRMEARTKQLVEVERKHFLSQLSQLIPNFDPNILKQRISQSPKNPMSSDKASCSGGDVRSLHVEDDTAKDEEKKEEKREEEKEEEKEKEDEEKHDDKVIEVGDYSNMEAPSSLKSLCRYVETTLLPEDKILEFTIDKEVFGSDRDTFLLPEDITQFAGMEEIGATVLAVYMRHLHDVLKQANMCSMVGFIDPATVSANSGTVAERSRLVAARLQKTDGEQIFMMPYNPGRHWILLIVRAKKETVYFLDPLSGTPKQPSNVECRYYVMRFMRDIIMDPSLGFENMYAKGNQEASYPQEAIDEVRNEWAETVFQFIK